jgi:hypothetical protein
MTDAPMRPIPKMPPRVSDKVTEAKKNPFVVWGLRGLQILFVILVFVLSGGNILVTGSILMALIIINVILLLRLLVSKKNITKKSEPVKPTETVKPKEKTISPYKEELVSEWKWLLKKLHIYDYESEEKNLLAYRKLRGWDK